MKYPRFLFKFGQFECQCPNKKSRPQINKCIEEYFKLSKHLHNEQKKKFLLGFSVIFTYRSNFLQVITLKMF